MLIPALLYIAWDIWFTAVGVWSFNDNYVTGIKLINLPLEEVLFFFVVPYCCLFIYECIRCYFPHMHNHKQWNTAMQVLAVVLFLFSFLFFNRAYSFYTFLFCALFILLLFWKRRVFKYFHTKAFFISYAVILIPFLIVNGFLTAIPVVQYNNDENLGVRIYTIPFEDIFYGMLLVMMNVAIFERLKHRYLKH